MHYEVDMSANRDVSRTDAKAGKTNPAKHSHSKGKGGKMSMHARVQLDFEEEAVSSNVGFCCLDLNGPADHVLGLGSAPRVGVHSGGSTVVAVVAGLIGAVMVSVAVASFLQRNYADAYSNDVYALPDTPVTGYRSPSEVDHLYAFPQ